jgi:hypothetical protein
LLYLFCAAAWLSGNHRKSGSARNTRLLAGFFPAPQGPLARTQPQCQVALVVLHISILAYLGLDVLGGRCVALGKPPEIWQRAQYPPACRIFPGPPRPPGPHPTPVPGSPGRFAHFHLGIFGFGCPGGALRGSRETTGNLAARAIPACLPDFSRPPKAPWPAPNPSARKPGSFCTFPSCFFVLGDRAPSAGPAWTRGRVPSAGAGPIKKSDGLDLNPMFLKKNLSCLPCGGYHLGEILTKKFFQPWRLRHYVFHARAQIFLRPENGPSSARLQIFTTCL